MEGETTLTVVVVASHNAWTANRGSMTFYAPLLTGIHQLSLMDVGVGVYQRPWSRSPEIRRTCCAAMADCRSLRQQQVPRHKSAFRSRAAALILGRSRDAREFDASSMDTNGKARVQLNVSYWIKIDTAPPRTSVYLENFWMSSRSGWRVGAGLKKYPSFVGLQEKPDSHTSITPLLSR